MTYPNSGTLFKNENKLDEKHADYNGDCVLNNVEYWIDAWIHTVNKPGPRQGKKFLSMSFKPKHKNT